LFFQLLFLPFSSTFSPVFTTHSDPPPTCHQTTPPSYTITTCWLAYCTNCTQPQPSVIPDTNTLHYNRNIPKHTQGPQNPAALIPLNLPTHHFPTPSFLGPPLPIPQNL
jgi:hypothetical protein